MPDCCAHAAEIQALHARLDALVAQLPPEPLYGLAQSALLLYITLGTLRVMLSKHRARLTPPRYRWDSRHRSHRMLPASDLAFLRARLLRPTTRRMTVAQRDAFALSQQNGHAAA